MPSGKGASSSARALDDAKQRNNVTPVSPGTPEVAAYREKVPPLDGLPALIA
ncbi:hypothetical protein [Corallococcus exiguus]|uniref:Uncharacterized protein n=1 Tax=Corallococcus exiguus TaxID=83462 RepID=A0A7X5BWH3_9BACT|nr:hypothetical protein [Corallococcus exiguus]NBC46259.1 hypothetical protein [Corallococcus exiguus]